MADEPNPKRPPLLQPGDRPPAPGDPSPTFGPPVPTEEQPSRSRRRMFSIIALITAFALLVAALGVQTWRLQHAGARASATAPTSPAVNPASPPSSSAPPSSPPSSTPPTTTTPLPPGLQQFANIPGIRCIADLFGNPPRARINRTTLLSQLQSVASWDEDARELQFKQVPEPVLLTRAGLADRVARDVSNSYSTQDADLDSRLLSSLGAVPAAYDMRNATTSLYGNQVAGFYDPTTKQLIVGSNDGRKPLDVLGEVTLAHELVHALTDQALGLPPLDVTTSPTGVLDTDRTTAQRSVVEGDATLVMYRYVLSALSLQQQQQFLNDPSLRNQAGAVAVPHFLEAQLMFPYAAGLDFVCALKQSSGWATVNAAYSQPPTTSAQVLFPDRFVAREAAIDPPDPGALGAPWSKDRAQTLGAADLLALFEAPGDDRNATLENPKGLVASWAGGETVQWSDGARTAVGVSLVERRNGGGGASSLAFRPTQQTTTAPGPLCNAMRDWYTKAFPLSTTGGQTGDEIAAWTGDRQSAVLRCAGTNVRLGIGPDIATARTIAQ
ncbi:MAG: hypothetical protein ACOYN3_07380 [Acidimicrobiia bacterium]